jgi:hypothetical protein
MGPMVFAGDTAKVAKPRVKHGATNLEADRLGVASGKFASC